MRDKVVSYHVSYVGGHTFDESTYFELRLFIQFEPHMELFKLSNILFSLEVILAKRSDIEVELLLVGGVVGAFSLHVF